MVDGNRLGPLRGGQAWRVADREYRLFQGLLDQLGADDWSRPTDCASWSVRDIAAHVLGATEANGRPREMVRQLARGRRGLGFEVDLVNAGQVRDRAELGGADLVGRLAAARSAAVAGRRRAARLAGRVPFRVGAPIHETWSVGYLMRTIYTRDTWMHRVDVCRAVGIRMGLSADHDGLIVADVVGEWMRRHGRPVSLRLTGPLGGDFAAGVAPAGPGPGEPVEPVERIEMDAVELMRTLSGREVGEGLLAFRVPF